MSPTLGPGDLRYPALTASELGTVIYWVQHARTVARAPGRVERALAKLRAARSKPDMPIVGETDPADGATLL
jgi:hypothetical protein